MSAAYIQRIRLVPQTFEEKNIQMGGGGIDEIVQLMDCTVYCHQYLSLLLTYPHSNISFTQISTNIKHFILKKMDPLN